MRDTRTMVGNNPVLMKLDVVVAALMVEQVDKLILINNELLIELKGSIAGM